MDTIQKGKKILLAMIITVLLISVLTTSMNFILYTTNGYREVAVTKLFQGGLRLILTMILCYFLYQGHRWAKGVSSILFFISGVFSLVILVKVFHLGLLLIGIIYTSLGFCLMNSGSVNTFLRSQRERVSL